MEHDTGAGKKEEAGGIKGPAVRLRISTLIMAVFLTFVAIAAAYLAGVMSGRNSTQSLAEREEAHSAPSPQMPDEQNKENMAGANNLNKGEHILSAEELEFARVLRRDENTPLSKLKGSPGKNVEAGKNDSAVQDSSPAPEAPPRQSLQKKLEAEKSDESSDYIFQVGAFKDEKSVDAIREKLEGQGLRTLMKREGRLYLVLVRLRGNASRAAELVGLFTELGLGEPILLRRSPVKP